MSAGADHGAGADALIAPRRTTTGRDECDADGIKLYRISARHEDVDASAYLPQLARLKAAQQRDWANTPAFAIFHDGAQARYLVLCHWGNDNELFTTVSVCVDGQWITDASRYSFCLWDLEVMWEERAVFIRTLYSGHGSLTEYRATRPLRWLVD